MRNSIRLAFVAGLMGAAALAFAQGDAFLGIWGTHFEYPIGLKGELTVSRAAGAWRASAAGVDGKFDPSAHDIRFAFPNDGGQFRGHMAGGRLEGYWVRRAVYEDPRYPEGAAQGYAMPLAFMSAGHGSWRAKIDPLPDPFTLYLDLFRDKDGALKAAFRDPEQNSHGPAMQLDASRQGDMLHFSAQPDPGRPLAVLDATLLHDPDRIRIDWPDAGRTLELTKFSPPQSDAFFARWPGSPAYTYRMPEETGDGWKVARAGSLGMDEKQLAHAVQTILDVDPAGARHSFQVHSLAVVYKGKLVLDEYFHGFTRDEPHDMRSASKTLTSVMLGTAMLRGVQISPQTRVYALMAPLGPFANPDPHKNEITIADFITHTPGLDCDDNNDADRNNEDHMESQRAQDDWWKFTLDLRSVYTPGTRYAYCSGNINVVGGAITMATKIWLPEWFDETVARPLKFGPWYWNIMPNGEGYAGGGAFIRTRDFLKLGQIFLDGGVWNGRRIVSAAWVKDSVAPHRRVSEQTTGRYGDAFRDVYGDGYDAYAWHLTDVTPDGRSYHAFFANGNGGQLLLVIPELDLAVMLTAGNYAQGIWIYLRDSIVGKEIIPAIPK